MDWLPALYIWLVVAVTGPFVAFVAGYLTNQRKAAFVGIAVTAVMALGAALDAAPKGNWWIALGAALGPGTAWWHLFRRESRQAS